MGQKFAIYATVYFENNYLGLTDVTDQIEEESQVDFGRDESVQDQPVVEEGQNKDKQQRPIELEQDFEAQLDDLNLDGETEGVSPPSPPSQLLIVDNSGAFRIC